MTAFWEGGEIEFLRDNFQWRSAPDLHLAPPGRNPEYALGNLIFFKHMVCCVVESSTKFVSAHVST